MKKRNTGRPVSKSMQSGDTPELLKAQELWEMGMQEKALVVFSKAIRRHPNNIKCYIIAARCYAHLYDFDKVWQIFTKLKKMFPNHPVVYQNLGDIYDMMSMPRESIAAYEKACDLAKASPTAYIGLAEQYEKSHRLEEAAELLDKAGDSGRKQPLYFFVRAALLKREGDIGPAIDQIKKLLNLVDEGSEWACRGNAELALIHDGIGEYELAVEMIERCKKAQRAGMSSHLRSSEEIMRSFSAAIDQFQPSQLEQWDEEVGNESQHPTAMLTGFPRSGTTLLEQVLDSHPGVVSSEERDFFNRGFFDPLRRKYGSKGASVLEILNSAKSSDVRVFQRRFFKVMENMLGEKIEDRVHLDKSPANNLFIPTTLRVFPRTKIILALRDPRDVILSCYLRYLPMNPMSVNFLSPELAVERYATDMKAWLRMKELLPTNWSEIRYEDCIENLENQARRALEALNLDWNPCVMKYRERIGKERIISSPTYEAVTQPIHSKAVGRWKNYSSLIEPVYERLEPFIEEFGYIR